MQKRVIASSFDTVEIAAIDEAVSCGLADSRVNFVRSAVTEKLAALKQEPEPLIAKKYDVDEKTARHIIHETTADAMRMEIQELWSKFDEAKKSLITLELKLTREFSELFEKWFDLSSNDYPLLSVSAQFAAALRLHMPDIVFGDYRSSFTLPKPKTLSQWRKIRRKLRAFLNRQRLQVNAFNTSIKEVEEALRETRDWGKHLALHARIHKLEGRGVLDC